MGFLSCNCGKDVEPGLDLCNECDLIENPPTKRFLLTWEKMVALVRRINQYIKEYARGL